MKEGLALMALHAWTAASDHGHGGHAQGQFICWLRTAGAWKPWRREWGKCNLVSLRIPLK